MTHSRKSLFILSVIAVALLVFFAQRRLVPMPYGTTTTALRPMGMSESYVGGMPVSDMALEESMSKNVASAPMVQSVAPGTFSRGIVSPTAGGQMFTQDTSLSLVTSEPMVAVDKIVKTANELGGFLVSSWLSRPQEMASATVTVRVPTEKLPEALEKFEAAGQRVVQKSVQGQDVTQQYQDIEAQLATLDATKAKLEELFDRATDASDLLEIQQHISGIQSQKDSLEGQRRYLREAANLSLVTVHLASDELALPYVPAEQWSPEAVFRQAVRSVVTLLRGVGTGAIWAAVYLPLALPVIGLMWWSSRRRK